MHIERTLDTTVALSLSGKMRDYGQLLKLRLTSLVMFSTFAGFMLAPAISVNWFHLLIVLTGGFLVVGAANGLNQIIEKDSDKLMKRTENRPLAQGRLSVTEAGIFCTLAGIAGVFLLGNFLNPLSGIISFISLILYAFFYTPLKKYSPIAVFVGAIPGALPPLIGYVAVTGVIDSTAAILFLIQFIWQFPHFWAIAWLLNDDYTKAGIKLLPSGDKKDKAGALQIASFTLLLIPLSVLPAQFGFAGAFSVITGIVAGFYFFIQTLKLFSSLNDESAKKVMFGGFIYLPLVQISYLIDKWIL
jgi:heme o synthase